SNFLRIQIEHVLVPHAAQFDPFHPEIMGRDFAGALKILSDLVVDHSNPEWRLHSVNPSLLSTYFLLINAESLGVRERSGTLSSSTTTQPRKCTWRSASVIAGRSTFPRPSSTKRYACSGSALAGSSSTSFM